MYKTILFQMIHLLGIRELRVFILHEALYLQGNKITQTNNFFSNTVMII